MKVPGGASSADNKKPFTSEDDEHESTTRQTIWCVFLGWVTVLVGDLLKEV